MLSVSFCCFSRKSAPRSIIWSAKARQAVRFSEQRRRDFCFLQRSEDPTKVNRLQTLFHKCLFRGRRPRASDLSCLATAEVADASILRRNAKHTSAASVTQHQLGHLTGEEAVKTSKSAENTCAAACHQGAGPQKQVCGRCVHCFFNVQFCFPPDGGARSTANLDSLSSVSVRGVRLTPPFLSLFLKSSSKNNKHPHVGRCSRAAIFIGPITLHLNKRNLWASSKVKARQYIRVPALYCRSVIALLVA